MKQLLLALAFVSLAFAPAATAQEEGAAAGQNVVVKLDHLTDDLHAAFMGMKIAIGLAEEGADVAVFVNLEAARLADRRQPIDLAWGHSSGTLAALYDSLIANGGEVLVCPHCARAVGMTAADLRTGARILTHEDVIATFAGADKVISY